MNARSNGLTPRDISMFDAIRVRLDIVYAAGVRRVDDREARLDFGFKGSGNFDGILFPYYRPASNTPVTYRLRRDAPEVDEKGQPKNKYITAYGNARSLYYPQNCLDLLQDISVPIIFVEAEKSVLAISALTQRAGVRFLPIGLGGVWGWRGKRGKVLQPDGSRTDQRGPLSDFDHVHWRERRVIICFDSGIVANRQVQDAETALFRELRRRGADVFCGRVPIEEGVNGPDDYIGHHPNDEDFLRILEQAESHPTPPLIRIFGGSLADNVRDAEAALANWTLASPQEGIYQRSGSLLRIARLTAESTGPIRRPAGALHLMPADPDAVRFAMSRAARWEKMDKRANAWVPGDPPADVARTVTAISGQWPNLPLLAGIIETPTLRQDGSLLCRPGYDASTRLYFDPAGTDFPSMPAKPSRKDALAALARFQDLIQAFPFVDDVSRSVHIALMLTPLVRHLLRTAPLTVVSAPTPGSGKSLLSSLPAYIATGREPTMMPQPETPEEEKKRIIAVLIEGSAVTIIDNCSRPLESDALCIVLTQSVYRDRLLGTNRTVIVPTATTWVATGNNLDVRGDLASRTLLCSIDPKCERPEARHFDVDLYTEAPQRRGELAIAGLTIVRAYLASGAPPQSLPAFGRFEDWSRYVRAPLVWLGLTDPCKSRERVINKDAHREQLVSLLQAWSAMFKDKPTTVSAAIKAVDTADMQDVQEALKAAMLGIADDRGKINQRAIGNFISKHEHRIEQGMRFARDPVLFRSAVQWQVERFETERIVL